MTKSIRLLKIPINLIYKIEAMGIYQISGLISNLNNLDLKDEEYQLIRKSLDDFKIEQTNQELIGFKEEDKYEFINSLYSLDDLNLSIRAMNALNNYGIFTVSKLLVLIEKLDIYNVDNLGSKSIVQVLESVRKIVESENLMNSISCYSPNIIMDEVPVQNMGFNQGALESLEKLGLINIGELRKVYLSGELSIIFNYKTLYVIIEKVKDYFILKPDEDFYFLKLFLIEDKLGLISYDDLSQHINRFNLPISLDNILERLKDRKDFVFEKDYLRLPYFLEKLEAAHLKKESEEILLERFSGNTLQNVANKFKKTRERIRQIVRDRMLSITMFYEEAFVKEYNKYLWHPSIFMSIFDLNELSYNIIKYLGKNYPFEQNYVFPESYVIELMEEGKIKKFNMDYFKLAHPDVFPERIQIYGKFMDRLSKREFLEYCIREFVPRSGVHKKKIIGIANKVSKENNLEYLYEKYIDIVTNTVQSLQTVRYYDYEKLDEEAFIGFKKILYQVDSVYSCTYFYLLHKDFLHKYDIRDGYELHFVLRRFFSRDEEFTSFLDFNRQPMIAKKGLSFSDVVLENWKALKEPINSEVFTENLIRKYGYHKGTLVNIINATLGDYISLRTVYNYEAVLDSEIKPKLRSILKDEFYEIIELANILKDNGIERKMYKYFSNSWLNEFGYKTHDINYVIKSHFASLKHVFYDRVLKDDVYQITKKDHQMRETTLILFIENLREEYLAFLSKNNRLVTMRYLDAKGIKKDDVVKYVDALKNYIHKEEYFTYYSLKKRQYQKTNPIFQKIEDFKLDSELMNSFVRNLPGIKKTTKGNLYRISKNQTTIAEFLEYISKTHEISDYKTLKTFVKDNYGITIRNLE